MERGQRRRIRSACVGALSLALTLLPRISSAAEPAAERQADLAGRTRAVADSIDAVVGELDENGLGGGEDARTLAAVRDVLGRLSDGQMRQVADLLRRGDTPAAYAGQQDVVAQLRALLGRYQRQQAAAEVADRLGALADRQDANLRATVDAARASLARGGKRASAEQRESLRNAQAEQSQLTAAVGAAMADVKALPGEPPAAMADAVAARAGTTGADLSAGHVLRAAAGEQTVRDELRDLARRVGPPPSRAEAAERAAERIDRAIAEQKRAIAGAEAARDKGALAAAERDQAAAADDAGRAGPDAADVAPAAAAPLGAAGEAMRQADAGLSGGRRDAAVKQGRAALSQLEQARAAVTDATRADGPAGDPAARHGADLAADQAKAAADEQQRQSLAKAEAERDRAATAVDKQADAVAANDAGRQRAATAATDAVRASPGEAQKAVESAKAAMAEAQRKLDAADPAGARAGQRDALAKLAEAKGSLDEQVAKLRGATSRPAATDAALAKLTSQLQAAGSLAQRAAAEAKAGQAEQASGDLRQAAAAAAKGAAADEGLLGPGGRQSMRQAQAALARASDAADHGHADAAAAQAGAARQAMADAAVSAQVAAGSGGGGEQATATGSAGGPMARGDSRGGGAFVGLPPRDRAAVEQGQRDPVSPEYGGLVEQYYRNLSDGAGGNR